MIKNIVRNIIHGLIWADIRIIIAYERFVGDPLQHRGISLNTQRRSMFVVLAACTMFPVFYWPWQTVCSAVWVYRAFFSILPDLEPPPSDEITMNRRKVLLNCFIGRTINYLISLCWVIPVMFATRLDLILFLFCFSLYDVVAACDPKPPAPKRIKVLVAAHDAV
jgi:hypothetical protein